MIIDTKLDLFKYGTPKVITKNLKRILEGPRSYLQRITWGKHDRNTKAPNKCWGFW